MPLTSLANASRENKVDDAKQGERVIVRVTVERGPHAGVSRGVLLTRAKRMLTALELNDVELSLVLTDDERIHHLNKEYRGIDRPTDVLAFAMNEGEFASVTSGLLGDVIISVPTARRQSEAADRDVLSEVTMLLAHGLLHLLGWDHDTDARDKKMQAETDRLCKLAVDRSRTLIL